MLPALAGEPSNLPLTLRPHLCSAFAFSNRQGPHDAASALADSLFRSLRPFLADHVLSVSEHFVYLRTTHIFFLQLVAKQVLIGAGELPVRMREQIVDGVYYSRAPLLPRCIAPPALSVELIVLSPKFVEPVEGSELIE